MTVELSGVRLQRPRRGTRVVDLAPGDVLVIDGRPFVIWRKCDSGRLLVRPWKARDARCEGRA